MSGYVLELNNINKCFGSNHVVKNVNLKIKEGSFVTFLGPSGCGKTTLLRMIAGFYEPDEGEILIRGSRIDKLPPYARNTAMVFQEYALFPHLSVFENVAYGLKVRNESKEIISQKVKQALELMQLAGMEERYPNQMSGGQQQRVALARALVMNPVALLLDEPLSNLDAKLRESVRVELRQIQKKMGLTAIYVTHDQQEALSMSDLIVVMNKGVIHQIGTPLEIYFTPATPFVADFIGTTNLLQATVNKINDKEVMLDYEGHTLVVNSSQNLTIGESVWLSIRPESIKLTQEKQEGCSSLEAEITQEMFLGEKVRYFLNDNTGKEWLVDIYDPGTELFSGKVYIAIEKSRPHIIHGSTIK